MQANEVKIVLGESMPNAEVFVEGEGCDLRLTIISDQFQGVLPVKRQQMIYSYLDSFIASGEIHAITMKTLTRDEWEKHKSNT
ncbi:MAG: BolA/IbaG family iron-sulfur metabolism protein [Candidatus Endonucleobacter sp. (ex Gigantidas childressi)]|nr:BolA/IbaG family iron-sulfur metabolism protein [Candidatus Endonucleobacter sp. (ex Gigantidas childressi)]